MKKTPANFNKIKDFVLGKKYDLSVAFISSAAMRRAMKYKKLSAKKPRRLQSKVGVPTKASGKNDASNVLAFPLSKNSGEILLCPATARTQCKAYGMNERVFVAYLFIHGLLHLRGIPHGVTMERMEHKIAKRFGLRI
ncbi:MAG: rRNA maturation RNAse YbeY [bacterium]|nr:rRNA maturation RNAse YbeY [bacterium]